MEFLTINSSWSIFSFLDSSNGMHSMIFQFEQRFETQNPESNTTIILWLDIGLRSQMRRLVAGDFFQGIRVQLLLRFIFSFSLLNLVHYSTICTTNEILFISQMKVVSLGHTSVQDKWTLKTTLRWIHQGMKAKMTGTSQSCWHLIP